MTPFRQLIRPGQAGSDVRAVKRAMRDRMHVPKSEGLATSGRAGRYAGDVFVACLEHVQRSHGLKQDGIYGAATHKHVAPNFDAYGRLLYRTARIRKPQPPPAPVGDAAAMAKRLEAFHQQGRFHDDRGTIMQQIRATAAGQPVWSPMGRYVHIDARPLRLLVWMLENKFREVGLFAICSDHGYDSPRGHAGGYAVDISSVDGVTVASSSAHAATLKAAEAIRVAPSLVPWQLICDGYGYQRSPDIEACCIPSAAFYGWATLQGHRNHLHAGYAP